MAIFLNFLCFRNIHSYSSSFSILSEHLYYSFFSHSRTSSNAEAEDNITMTSNLPKVHSLKAAIFHTMAYKLSLEINKNKITPKSLIAFLKVLYHVTRIKKKKIPFEQNSRIHLECPRIAICETVSNVVFVLNSSFTTKEAIFAWLFKKQQMLSTVCFMILATHKNWKSTIRSNIKLIHSNNIL